MSKLKNNCVVSAFLLVTLILGIGCEGPQGPQGPIGPKGQQGDQGLAGPQGPMGTANVVYSTWINTNPWNSFVSFGLFRYYFDLQAPKLTTEILDKGTILIYIKLVNDSNQVRQIPFTYPVAGSEANFDYGATIGNIRIWITYLGNVGIPASNNLVRYVLIPGGTTSGRTTVDYSNYDQVKKVFNIPD